MNDQMHAETAGVLVEFPFGIVTLARAGGSNSQFKDILLKEMEPYRMAIAADELTEQSELRILARTYAQAAIRYWRGPDLPEFHKVDAVTEWLEDHPVEFADIRAIAEVEEHYCGGHFEYGND